LVYLYLQACWLSPSSHRQFRNNSW
jgi:hypothetical protein